MPLYRIYIGADNDNGKVDITAITNFLGTHYESFTLTPSHGHFRGKAEQSIVVTIAAKDINELKEQLRHLRKLLHQDGIGIEIDGHYERITNDKQTN